MAETKPSQEKGGLEVTITPVIYKAVRADKTIVTPAQPTFAEGIYAPPRHQREHMTFVQESVVPELKPQPEQLQFAVRINNKLARVFRGQGAVVQLNVGGKLIPINRSDYAELVDCIVPPRNEMELKIYGPTLDLVPEKSTVGIFFYDVVTATDAAGNVTEKQNYEWYFAYNTQVAQDTADSRTRRGWAENSALAALKEQNSHGSAGQSVIQTPVGGGR